ncbi:MAG: hypothetical protein A3B10_04650 [Candidatus Doudnabacteria bacterium RIFCSPLOWO2_01_FULL_44_21]|uniref:Uncharacterized protein n=1 Tax=Candidatus Doudnabacteria bacterium RIFCSPLOWO2_01_FULL_44_21 TaxID=1817841 RepID=A0A1F5PXM0_9BACT|nr:MAG: hypothetical protein A3B10_04650 [Candidatus Doudnabacteria bacterium RIFCSPLOWO2_01_FULL_44_21]
MDKGPKLAGIKPFLKTANGLIRKRIKTIEDIKGFYVGINGLAAQVVSGSAVANTIRLESNADNLKLLKGIASILAYGEAARRSPLFADASLATLEVGAFLRTNPRIKTNERVIQKEATLYFNTLANRVKKLEDEAKISKEDHVQIEVLKEEIRQIKEAGTSSVVEKDISVGFLGYKDRSIHYKGSRMKLAHQSVKLCRLLMENPDAYVDDSTIGKRITNNGPLTHESIQKAVSKLRCDLREQHCKLAIEPVNKSGYKWTTANIR